MEDSRGEAAPSGSSGASRGRRWMIEHFGQPLDPKGEVRFNYKGIKHEARYEVVGAVMTMSCRFGTFKASVGCSEPKTFARTLLRSLCRRFEAAQPNGCASIVSATDPSAGRPAAP